MHQRPDHHVNVHRPVRMRLNQKIPFSFSNREIRSEAGLVFLFATVVTAIVDGIALSPQQLPGEIVASKPVIHQTYFVR